MASQAADLARRLARDAEAACRHYLSNGRRQGRYWIVGDVANTPGRSLHVRLVGADSGPGASGKWIDFATGQYGDLLDLIALNRGVDNPRDPLDEARRFLALPRPEPSHPAVAESRSQSRTQAAASEAARRLFRAGRPVPGTPAEAYLRARGVTAPLDEPALRFHSAVWYRAHEGAPRQSFPALLAAVGDPRGLITGLQRTFLDPRRPAKAPIADPRRALRSLLGNGVWLGLDPAAPLDVLAAGEGLETMLALRSVLPRMPMAAALPATNLAALAFPPALVRLYVARDNDAAGLMALKRLCARGQAAGIEVLDLASALGDWNDDLRAFGPIELRHRLAGLLAAEDFARFASYRDAAMPPMRCVSSADASAGPERAGRSRISAGLPAPVMDRARGLPERRFARARVGPQRPRQSFFLSSLPGVAGTPCRKKDWRWPSSANAPAPRPAEAGRGCGPTPALARDRREGREKRGHTGKQEPAMIHDLPAFLTSGDESGDEAHAASQTARVCEEMALYGTRPGPGEPDTRPMPEPEAVAAALAGIVENLSGVLAGTRLDDDLDPLLWAFANLFHRHAGRVERSLDDNEQAQRRSQAEQDGSEIRSVELERLIDQGQVLIERRDAFEAMRDLAAEHYEAAVGSAWRPYAGSKVNRRAMTAAVIDSRDFIAARRIAETEVLVPKGARIAFTGGMDYNDLGKIYAVLDRVRAKYAGMVLLHGGSPRGAERIAACWADDRKVAQVVFKPDWTKHRKAAPFKRNDQMLDALPIGLVAFPGSGISGNLADKARKLGIPVLGFAGSGA